MLAYNGFPRFASNVTLANLLVTSMAAKPFDPHTCTSEGIGLTRTQDHGVMLGTQRVDRLSHPRLDFAHVHI